MKVDTPFPQPPVAAPVPRPAQDQAEQASARPVDRPHHDEAADNRQPRNDAPQTLSVDQDAAPSRETAERHAASGRHDETASQQQQTGPRNATEPSQVGDLLDVLA
jgi:hypothetical protein